jgi:hypothetical protein
MRARFAAIEGNRGIIEELINLVDRLCSDLARCTHLIDENIQEVEEVAAALCGWTEGEDHAKDMRVSLACAAMLAGREDAPAPPPASVAVEVEPYRQEKRGKILIIQDGKFAVIECYDGSIVLPMGTSLTGESAAQAACRGADVLAGLSAEVTRSFAPFFSAEDGAATSVFLGRACGPSRPHPVHAMGYLRWVDFREARRRLSGVDAKALSSFFPEEKWDA